MKRFTNKIDMPTSRRNVLRGTVLAGAAAASGAGAFAMPRRAPISTASADAASAQLHRVAETITAESDTKPAELSGYTRVRQELVAPPFAPAHEQVATGGPKIVEITMETTERLMVVDEDTGASVWALTYNGSVPGPLIICHEGDMVELTLRNPT